MKILEIPQSGKLGTIVGQSGRFGQIRRTLAIPADPKTPIQMILRRNLTRVARSWKSLTQVEQQAWITEAATVMSARKGGTRGALFGVQLYSGINCTNLLCGNDMVRLPPPKPNLGPPVATALAITNPAGVVTLQLATVGAPTQADPWIVSASKPQSPGFNKCDHIHIIGLAPAPQNGVCDISALYTVRYGVPPVGWKIWVSISATHAGWQEPPATFMQPVPPAT